MDDDLWLRVEGTVRLGEPLVRLLDFCNSNVRSFEFVQMHVFVDSGVSPCQSPSRTLVAGTRRQ